MIEENVAMEEALKTALKNSVTKSMQNRGNQEERRRMMTTDNWRWCVSN